MKSKWACCRPKFSHANLLSGGLKIRFKPMHGPKRLCKSRARYDSGRQKHISADLCFWFWSLKKISNKLHSAQFPIRFPAGEFRYPPCIWNQRKFMTETSFAGPGSETSLPGKMWHGTTCACTECVLAHFLPAAWRVPNANQIDRNILKLRLFFLITVLSGF